jgi:hypothetical protein
LSLPLGETANAPKILINQAACRLRHRYHGLLSPINTSEGMRIANDNDMDEEITY